MAAFKKAEGKRGFKGAPRGSFGAGKSLGGGFGGGKKFGGGFGGPKKFGAKKFGRDTRDSRDERPQVMYAAVCSTCGNPCQVPFLPSSDKPVYCRDCFAGRAALGGDRSSHKERKFPLAAGRTPQPHSAIDSAGGHGLKKQVEAMNAKLDRLIEVVETLVAGKE